MQLSQKLQNLKKLKQKKLAKSNHKLYKLKNQLMTINFSEQMNNLSPYGGGAIQQR